MSRQKVEYIHIDSEHTTKDGKQILPLLFKHLMPTSILDLGCGSGTWLAAAKELGVETVKGIDGLDLADAVLKIKRDEFVVQNLGSLFDLNQKYDLCICLEVAEHLDPDLAENLVSNLVAHSDVILFSAAIPCQSGDHHFNEQWPAYWQKLFMKKGFYPFDILRSIIWENEEINWWYRQNIIVYATRQYEANFGKYTEKVLPLVHPGLLEMKDRELTSCALRVNSMMKEFVLKPSFIPSLKQVAKSLIRIVK